MRVTFGLPFRVRGERQFFELGVWPRGPGARFLLCLGTWVHLGYCDRWWIDWL